MPEPALYARCTERRLLEALGESPVVLIHGPRQCGKTTLARMVAEPAGFTYLTFDDDVTCAAALADPAGFVAGLPGRVILDEIQRVPRLLAAIKASVDRKRVAGRFLLTGSANVLVVPQLADSLAGRMEIVRLHPLSQAEQGRCESRFLDALFSASFPLLAGPRLSADLAERVAAGGYPAALARGSSRRRAVWYRDYQESIVQRDVRDIGRIRSLDVLPRLLAIAAGATANLLNVSELATPFQVTRPTIREYLTLLERVFLLDLLPPWFGNRLQRLVKTPKLHMGDSGLACSLLGLDAQALLRQRELLGHMVETFAYQELRRLASGDDGPLTFHHYRDRDGNEVDIVIERGGDTVAGVEVKAGGTVRPKDFKGLHRLKEAAGNRFACGVVLYDGEVCVPFAPGLFAVPISALWAPG